MVLSKNLSSAGDLDVVFGKLSPSDGSLIVAKRLGGTQYEGGYAVAEDVGGRFYVGGDSTGFAEFGGGTLTSAGGSDAYVVSLAQLF